MLVGIVTKNGIVLIDFINLMRERGIRLYDAIAQACRSRLRPVLMTSLTTILGMVPMAISAGEGSETGKQGDLMGGGITAGYQLRLNKALTLDFRQEVRTSGEESTRLDDPGGI